ncbi:MAG: tetratricopeptide repeat protein [Anaerolineae bacterium]
MTQATNTPLTSWFTKGNRLADQGQHAKAIACFDCVLELEPHNVVAWFNKGNSLDSHGREEEAILCYDQAIDLDPLYLDAWCNKGYSLYSLERYAEAIACFTQALVIDPINAEVWYNKAVTEDDYGQAEAAVKSYRRYLALVEDKVTEDTEYANERLRELGGK